ncbi:MAG: hypothetical protein LC667_06990 [Thioalkalivibrio sp.]|nr:hypothetical protein [Thioalkalivibrio sp.]
MHPAALRETSGHIVALVPRTYGNTSVFFTIGFDVRACLPARTMSPGFFALPLIGELGKWRRAGLLTVFLRAVETTIRQRSPGAPTAARFGAVAFVHRFGGYLTATCTSTCW